MTPYRIRVVKDRRRGSEAEPWAVVASHVERINMDTQFACVEGTIWATWEQAMVAANECVRLTTTEDVLRPPDTRTAYVVDQTGATYAFWDQEDAESCLVGEAWRGAQHLSICQVEAPANLNGEALAEWCASNAPIPSQDCEN